MSKCPKAQVQLCLCNISYTDWKIFERLVPRKQTDEYWKMDQYEMNSPVDPNLNFKLTHRHEVDVVDVWYDKRGKNSLYERRHPSITTKNARRLMFSCQTLHRPFQDTLTMHFLYLQGKFFKIRSSKRRRCWNLASFTTLWYYIDLISSWKWTWCHYTSLHTNRRFDGFFFVSFFFISVAFTPATQQLLAFQLHLT